MAGFLMVVVTLRLSWGWREGLRTQAASVLRVVIVGQLSARFKPRNREKNAAVDCKCKGPF